MKKILVLAVLTLVSLFIFASCDKTDSIHYSEGLEFTSNDDGTCYVSGIGSCTDANISISFTSPDGDRVTSIGEEAFYGCTGITSIVIPDSVEKIGKEAFAYCSNLSEITLGESLRAIGVFAFLGCTNFTSITVDEDNTSYQSIDGNLYSKDGKTLIQYPIGKKNTSFTIPDSATRIGGSAFYRCTGLTSIVIPDSVTSIGDYAFDGCIGLTSIVIPDSVTNIGRCAFDGCTGLTSIAIPDSVKSIGYSTFKNCTGLTIIVIPDSVTSIGDCAFWDCISLKDVYYTGTEAEWAKISIGSENDYLTNATIHYNYVPAN